MLRKIIVLAALLACVGNAAAEWHSGKPLTNVFRMPSEFAADEALYQAKRLGRDRVVVAKHQAREQEPRLGAAAD